MKLTDDDIDIDRRVGELIESGLKFYESGDMEGALGKWKHALALDPDNERAANYLEFVEEHHDLAADPEQNAGESTVELSYPFGVSDLGLAQLTDEELEDYESIEIVDAAEEEARKARTVSEPSVDDGWNVDEGWVQDLVKKGEESIAAAAAPANADEGASKYDQATVDVSIDFATGGDDERATNIHRPSQKLKAVSGIGDLELEMPDGDSEPDEEEQTRARLDTSPKAIGGRGFEIEGLELGFDGDEENTAFHDNPNRMGAAHNAPSGDFGELELDGVDIGLPGDPDVGDVTRSTRIPDAIDSIDLDGGTLGFGGGPTLEFHDGDDNEAGDEEKTSIHGGQARGGFLRGETSDMDVTRQHFAIDDEMTVDRTDARPIGRAPRAPTQDPNISPSTIQVDDALLSLQESTREFNLGDMGLAMPGDEDEEVTAGGPSVAPSAPVAAIPHIKITPPGSDFASPDAETEAIESGVLTEILREAPSGDDAEKTQYVVERLIQHAEDEFTEDRLASAAASACQALDYAADSATAQKLIFENERQLIQILIGSLGDASQVPRLVCPLSEIPAEHINHRAAFLLTRLDEAMTLDELLDISGMPKLEALRHLCGLHILSYLEVV